MVDLGGGLNFATYITNLPYVRLENIGGHQPHIIPPMNFLDLSLELVFNNTPASKDLLLHISIFNNR